MNVYLPIEVKVRELEGKALLAMVAAEMGHTVILGEKKDTLNLAKKEGILPPGIVHDKSLTPGDYKINNFTQLKKQGHLVTAQDEESGLLDESFDEFARRRFSEKTVSLADKIFAWGPHDSLSLKKIYPKHAEKFVSVGSPRVDFWRKELDSYYKNTVTEAKDYILVASNFGFPIDENLFWDRIARLRKAGYFERDPNMEKYMYENTAYQYRLLHEFIVMIRNLSESFPERTIVVRPHPVESIDAWKKLLGNYPNVMIERKGSIGGWIRNAVVLLHNGCTSALEAAVSGLPRIAYRPIPHEIEREIPNNVSIHAFSYAELKEQINAILDTGEIKGREMAKKMSKKIITDRIASTDGTFASEKIVTEWENMARSANLQTSEAQDLIQSKPKNDINLSLKFKRQAVVIRDLLLGKQSAKKTGQTGLKTNHKFPSLSDQEINEITTKLRQTLHRFENVKTVRFGEKSFIFHTDNN